MRLIQALLLGTSFAFLSIPADGQVTKSTDPKSKTDPKTKNEPAKKEFTGKLKDVRLGDHVSGPQVSASSLNNRVVFLDLWGINCAPCLAMMPGTAALYNELSEFGLVVLGSHVQAGSMDKVRAVAQGLGATFPISIQTRLTTDTTSNTIPHSYLFDHKGQGLFAGMPKDAELLIRTAVGRMIVENAGGKDKFAGGVQSIANDLKAGKPPLPMVARLAALKSQSGDVGKDATALYDSLTSIGQSKLKQAEASIESGDHLSAFIVLERMPTLWKGTAIGTKASELVTKLKKEKSVTAELAARPMLDAVKKLEVPLLGTIDAANPALEDYQKKHAKPLMALKAKVVQMQKMYPDAAATRSAIEIATRYAIDLNEK